MAAGLAAHHCGSLAPGDRAASRRRPRHDAAAGPLWPGGSVEVQGIRRVQPAAEYSPGEGPCLQLQAHARRLGCTHSHGEHTYTCLRRWRPLSPEAPRSGVGLVMWRWATHRTTLSPTARSIMR